VTRFARIISWIGHPLVFITSSVAIVVALQLANRTGLVVLATLLVSVILPTAFLLFRGVRSGRWSDADVSVRTERTRFYPRAIPFSALAVAALWFMHAPDFVLRGAIVTLVLLVLAALANFRVKLSLHALFAFYCTVILFRIGPLIGICALSFALLVFWSRLYLQRHDLLEMLTGALLGIGGGIAAAWWP
jgi:hypothetical protein